MIVCVNYKNKVSKYKHGFLLVIVGYRFKKGGSGGLGDRTKSFITKWIEIVLDALTIALHLYTS